MFGDHSQLSIVSILHAQYLLLVAKTLEYPLVDIVL